MLFPAITGLGEAVSDTDKSAPAVTPTIVLTVAVLLAEFGSLADELTDAVSVMTVPFAVPLFTFTTSVNVPAVDPSMLEMLQTTFPVPPTPGLRHVHPAGGTTDTNVVFA